MTKKHEHLFKIERTSMDKKAFIYFMDFFCDGCQKALFVTGNFSYHKWPDGGEIRLRADDKNF